MTGIVLFEISFLWAIFSLRQELSKPHEIKKVRQNLFREKYLYKRNEN